MELMPGAAELAEAFARDGVVCVRSALDSGEVAAAASGIEAVLASPGPLARCGRPVGGVCSVVNGKAAG